MKTIAFIDASNLFYGGEKSLGWKIDYNKLFVYLKNKYDVDKVFYFGGVEIYDFQYDYLNDETVSLDQLYQHISLFIQNNADKLTDPELILFNRHLKRIKFYKKLENFGYKLYLRPVKIYYQEDGTTRKKANCDVEMTFQIMKEINNFDKAIVLSGDGDFLSVLKYLKKEGKEVIILARGERTAKEIRKFAGGSFRDFVRLKTLIEFL